MGLFPAKVCHWLVSLFNVLYCTQANLSSSVNQSMLFLDEVQI